MSIHDVSYGIAATSVLARFLTRDGHCNTIRVKEGAFLPPPDGELSAFVTDGLSNDDEIHALGRAHVSTPDRKCRGFAEISVANVTRHELLVSRNDQPPRHVLVTGWPEKHLQKSIAQQMAADAILHYAPHEYNDA